MKPKILWFWLKNVAKTTRLVGCSLGIFLFAVHTPKKASIYEWHLDTLSNSIKLRGDKRWINVQKYNNFAWKLLRNSQSFSLLLPAPGSLYFRFWWTACKKWNADIKLDISDRYLWAESEKNSVKKRRTLKVELRTSGLSVLRSTAELQDKLR